MHIFSFLCNDFAAKGDIWLSIKGSPILLMMIIMLMEMVMIMMTTVDFHSGTFCKKEAVNSMISAVTSMPSCSQRNRQPECTRPLDRSFVRCQRRGGGQCSLCSDKHGPGRVSESRGPEQICCHRPHRAFAMQVSQQKVSLTSLPSRVSCTQRHSCVLVRPINWISMAIVIFFWEESFEDFCLTCLMQSWLALGGIGRGPNLRTWGRRCSMWQGRLSLSLHHCSQNYTAVKHGPQCEAFSFFPSLLGIKLLDSVHKPQGLKMFKVSCSQTWTVLMRRFTSQVPWAATGMGCSLHQNCWWSSESVCLELVQII